MSAFQNTQAVLREADALYAPYSCPATAECCQLTARGKEPWLYAPEWELLMDALEAHERPLPPERPDGACPFLDAAGHRCTVYAARPLGCRTFFCHRRTGPQKEPPAANMDALIRRLEATAAVGEETPSPKPLSEWHRLSVAMRQAG
ncbi:MAG: YkgJ family cysteine cluster protein [Myxococcaceae bacterium]